MKRPAVIALFVLGGALLFVGVVSTVIALRQSDGSSSKSGAEKSTKKKSKSEGSNIDRRIRVARDLVEQDALDDAERLLRRIADELQAPEAARNAMQRKRGAETYYLLARVAEKRLSYPPPPKTLQEARAALKTLQSIDMEASRPYAAVWPWREPFFSTCSKVRIAIMRERRYDVVKQWQLPADTSADDRAAFDELKKEDLADAAEIARDSYVVVVDHLKPGAGCVEEARAGHQRMLKHALEN